MKKTIAALLIIFCISSSVPAQNVYPSNWWVGMKDPNLQLMIHYKDITSIIPFYKLPASGMKLADGITMKGMHHTENPNYVFLDLVIDKNASEGGYLFTLKKDNTVNTVPLGCCDIGTGSP